MLICACKPEDFQNFFTESSAELLKFTYIEIIRIEPNVQLWKIVAAVVDQFRAENSQTDSLGVNTKSYIKINPPSSPFSSAEIENILLFIYVISSNPELNYELLKFLLCKHLELIIESLTLQRKLSLSTLDVEVELNDPIFSSVKLKKSQNLDNRQEQTPLLKITSNQSLLNEFFSFYTSFLLKFDLLQVYSENPRFVVLFFQIIKKSSDLKTFCEISNIIFNPDQTHVKIQSFLAAECLKCLTHFIYSSQLELKTMDFLVNHLEVTTYLSSEYPYPPQVSPETETLSQSLDFNCEDSILTDPKINPHLGSLHRPVLDEAKKLEFFYSLIQDMLAGA
ncbi:hypothetical protein AYI70_g8803 [Smittium culicis]|uniref:Uncharacterized protein n=1 Tax=Smittium culicis TaxID=133412 RepID=A0A1R1XED3_9FUNG|nr:hypothetical protein AYI70_g8803 [Smittium culicis]